MPSWLESASIYVPDWGHLLEAGIGGLIEEMESIRRDAAPAAQDTLKGKRMLMTHARPRGTASRGRPVR